MNIVLDMAMNYIDLLEVDKDGISALEDILDQLEELKYPSADELELEEYIKSRLNLLKETAMMIEKLS